MNGTRSKIFDVLSLTGFALGLLLFIGCGGGGGGTTGVTTSTTATTSTTSTTATTAGNINVTVSPASVTLPAGDVQQFTATVTGTSNTGVTWSVQQGSAGGIIDATGFYEAPDVAGTYNVLAVSNADPSKTGSAQVQVTPGVIVDISPQFPVIGKGSQLQFSATVQNASNTAVEWSVFPQQGVPDVGTISATGLYTAPQQAGSFVVQALSVEDPLGTNGDYFTIVTVQ